MRLPKSKGGSAAERRRSLPRLVRPMNARRNERGVALVITLSFLLIATALVIAFLVRSRFDVQASASYSASVQSDLLAAGAMDQVVAGFVGEIAAGSDVPDGLPEGFSWFEPKEEGSIFPSMIPSRTSSAGDDPPFNNLIKQSLHGRDFFPGAANTPGAEIASDVGTDEESPAGRVVPAERWGLPRLLGDETSALAANLTPVPDWVYVTRTGESTAEVPSDGDPQIAGRYAYNVYDVGGLLNINVAGNDGATPNDIGMKGAATLADLTELPGLNDGAVTRLLDWRAPFVSWNVTGEPDAEIQPGDLTLLDYLRLGAAGGWRRNPSALAGSGNQFLSRRDLIRYFDTEFGKDSAEVAALPFLTHFSIDADAPTFSPDTEILKVNSGRMIESNSGSGDVASVQKKVNPARAENIGDYTQADQTSVKAPALHRRFPLSRLALVQTDPTARGAAGSTEEFTRDYFGLVAEDDYTWRYRDSEGEMNRIKNLDEVALRSREPNFFEILKSVIQAGSLGQYKQPIDNLPTNTLEPFANRLDEHVFRIGAAIIDQADADSLPTRILFDPDSSTSFGEIYGVEDLPYTYFLRFVPYRSSNSDPRFLTCMLQISLWNPHNPERSNYPNGAAFPQGFKVVSRSMAPLYLRQLQPGDPPGLGWDKVTPTGVSFSPATHNMQFEWEPASGIFRQPQGLLSPTYPTVVTATDSTPVAATEIANLNWPQSPFADAPIAVGFKLGDYDGTKLQQENPANYPPAQTCVVVGGPVEFLLQYTPPGDSGTLTYDRFWFNPNAANLSSHGSNSSIDLVYFGGIFIGRGSGGYFQRLRDTTTADPNAQRAEAMYGKTDPRSQRFIWTSDVARFSGSTTAPQRWQVPETFGPGWYHGVGGGILMDQMEQLQSWWRMLKTPGDGDTRGFRPDVGFLALNDRRKIQGLGYGMYYEDHDGVARRAMGGLTNFPGYSEKYLNIIATSSAYNNKPRTEARGLPTQLRPVGPPQLTASQDYYIDRPIVLNRPFRSVGELAYAFRDVPWRNIDFSFPESGDTGLLDAFTVYENEADSTTPLVAGKVNLNVCSEPVLRALLSGAARQIPVAGSGVGMETLSPAVVGELKDRVVEYRSEGTPSEAADARNGPLRSLAELVGRVFSPGGGATSDSASFVGLHPEAVPGGNLDDQILTERLSATTRALADVGTVRTWNFMVDVVAQSGKVQTGASNLRDFNVSSESRWWLFVSIDRFTGKVLARSVERIVE